LNYADHAREEGLDIPTEPLLFAKWPSAVIGPGEAILVPSMSRQVDYEAELGVVIGKRGKRIPRDEALGHVEGYLCVNDVTARDLQDGDGQWTRSKSLDTFCPTGPVLVPRAEVDDPQSLSITCRVNGAVVQSSSTSEMVFGVAELIEHISRGVTLERGDLIATGTPGGIGASRKPPLFLRPGDEVTVEIEGVGTLVNPVEGDVDHGA
jgi:2-keto-4-pentenoate hydratase/2-oxohepta-3-ene-1,7-dioic acid hydratase in catechol pathway